MQVSYYYYTKIVFSGFFCELLLLYIFHNNIIQLKKQKSSPVPKLFLDPNLNGTGLCINFSRSDISVMVYLPIKEYDITSFMFISL